MVFQTQLKEMTDAEIEAQKEKASRGLDKLRNEREAEVQAVKDSYVGAMSKLETFIEEANAELKNREGITKENVDTEFPSDSATKA